MTDERPAEPDIQKLMREVDEFGDNVGGYGEDTELRRAVEAAAREMAITFAEERVRANWPCAVHGSCRHCAELTALARLKGQSDG